VLRVENEALSVAVNPRVGGTIVDIRHKPSGLAVLGKVPWDTVDAPIDSLAAPDEFVWLTRFTGGWPLMFPNGGDACTDAGLFHGFHGEASIAPWRAGEREGRIVMERRFYIVPVTMRREISLDGDVLVLRERVHSTGPLPMKVMWGQHVTFGSDLLDGPFELGGNAGLLSVDDDYDPPANPLVPGTLGTLSTIEGKSGPLDFTRPREPIASLAYLHGYSGDRAWASMRRVDGRIAAVLSWQADRFPCAWLWCEIEGNTDPPWYGRTRLVGIEPCTTRPASGIAGARRKGGTLLTLLPGATLDSEVRLQVTAADRPIRGIDDAGRARFGGG